jgi:hypothetical protein
MKTSHLLRTFTLAIVLFTSVSLLAGKPAPGPTQPSLSARSWIVWAWVGGQNLSDLRPDALTGVAGWSFPIPAFPYYANYAFTSYSAALTGRPALSVALEFHGTVRYDLEPTNTCVSPPTARLLIWTRATQIDAGAHNRWWSNPLAFGLDDGNTAILTVPLAPDQWSSVYGEFGNGSDVALADWNTTLAKPYRVGFTMGGGCFFGHGVAADPDASIALKGYTVQ